MSCQHRLVIPPSIKPFVIGTCKLCGAHKTLRNLWRAKDKARVMVRPGSRKYDEVVIWS